MALLLPKACVQYPLGELRYHKPSGVGEKRGVGKLPHPGTTYESWSLSDPSNHSGFRLPEGGTEEQESGDDSRVTPRDVNLTTAHWFTIKLSLAVLAWQTDI